MAPARSPILQAVFGVVAVICTSSKNPQSIRRPVANWRQTMASGSDHHEDDPQISLKIDGKRKQASKKRSTGTMAHRLRVAETYIADLNNYLDKSVRGLSLEFPVELSTQLIVRSLPRRTSQLSRADFFTHTHTRGVASFRGMSSGTARRGVQGDLSGSARDAAHRGRSCRSR